MKWFVSWSLGALAACTPAERELEPGQVVVETYVPAERVAVVWWTGSAYEVAGDVSNDAPLVTLPVAAPTPDVAAALAQSKVLFTAGGAYDADATSSYLGRVWSASAPVVVAYDDANGDGRLQLESDTLLAARVASVAALDDVDGFLAILQLWEVANFYELTGGRYTSVIPAYDPPFEGPEEGPELRAGGDARVHVFSTPEQTLTTLRCLGEVEERLYDSRSCTGTWNGAVFDFGDCEPPVLGEVPAQCESGALGNAEVWTDGERRCNGCTCGLQEWRYVWFVPGMEAPPGWACGSWHGCRRACDVVDGEAPEAQP